MGIARQTALGIALGLFSALLAVALLNLDWVLAALH
jgi:hypothetical protein